MTWMSRFDLGRLSGVLSDAQRARHSASAITEEARGPKNVQFLIPQLFKLVALLKI